MNVHRIAIVLAALISLAACTNYEIVPPESVNPLPAMTGTKVAIEAHKLSLDKDTAFTSGGYVKIDIAKIGSACSTVVGGKTTRIHKVRPTRICPWDIYLDEGEFSTAIRTSFNAANYIVGLPSPHVLVSPIITRISYTGRYFVHGEHTYGRASTAIRVEWHIRKTKDGPVIYKATYDARAAVETAIENPGSFVRVAMIDSANRLLADPKFHEIAKNAASR